MRTMNTTPHVNQPTGRRGEGDSKTVIIILVCVGGVLLLGCGVCVLPALLLPAVQRAREEARHTQSKNNLHQIGIAMHNFNAAEGHWVAGATTGSDGQPAHSWQTHLLPYLNQVALHQSIDFDVAWDDPSQGFVFQTSIPQYHHPSQTELVTARGFATSHYAGNVNVLLNDSELTLGDVTDGLSATIAAGEVASSFKAWGDPTNLRDPADGLSGGADQFGSSSFGRVNMLLMDGSVRTISVEIDRQVLQALSTPDGGEPVGSF